MEWEALANLSLFISGESNFGSEELIELTFLLCAKQIEKGQLSIWIDADEDVNPITIEIFDDEFGVLNAESLQAEMIGLFAQDSELISQDFVQFSEESQLAQYEVSFLTEDVDLDSSLIAISKQIKPVLESYEPKNVLEDKLKQFCLKGLAP